jgi:bacterioferritin-associated ferredoxin
MYVCICNALTDRTLREAITRTGSRCPEEAYAACGCRAKCGKCIGAISQLLGDRGLLPTSDLQGAN